MSRTSGRTTRMRGAAVQHFCKLGIQSHDQGAPMPGPYQHRTIGVQGRSSLGDECPKSPTNRFLALSKYGRQKLSSPDPNPKF
jgi:hypothetical protein